MEEKPVEIKQVSEREIWVGGNRIYLSEEGIIYMTTVGEQDEKTAIGLRDAFIKMANMVEGKVDLLIDANKARQPSSEARKIAQEGVLKYDKTGKVAIFGAGPVVRVIASFVIGAIRKKDMHFFETREEALAWLKG